MAFRCHGLVNASTKLQVPLEQINVQVDIQGLIASFTTDFHYVNHEDNPIEAVFIFPLESGLAVYEFDAIIDERKIKGRVEEKQEARDIYDDAISSGQTAFLLEESMDSDDIFKMSVGNLAQKKSALVKVKCVTSLKLTDDGEIQFVLPTILNPRYSPAESAGQLDNWSYGDPKVPTVDKPYKFSMTLDVECGSEVDSVSSPTHKVVVSQDNTHAKVTIPEIEKFEKDVEIVIKERDPCCPRFVAEKGKESDGDLMASTVVMMTYYPRDLLKENSQPSPGEYIFVIDRSGSMSGEKMNSAKQALVLFLKSLPPESYFNIISFGSHFEFLFKDGSRPYTDDNVKQACIEAEKMEANFGGTEIYRPLEELFKKKAIKNIERRVFVITDGEVGNTSQVVDLVRKKCESSSARCFTLGIGHGASTALVKGLANAGKGMYEFSRENERMQKKVISLLRSSGRPCMENICLEWIVPDNLSFYHVLGNASLLSLGHAFVVWGVFSESCTKFRNVAVKLSFDIGNKNYKKSLIFEMNKLTGEDSKALHVSLARVLIGNLCNKEVISDEDKQAVIGLSKQSGVLSKFTGYVGVDTGNMKPVIGTMLSRQIEGEDSLCSFDDSCCSEEDFDGLMEFDSAEPNISCFASAGLEEYNEWEEYDECQDEEKSKQSWERERSQLGDTQPRRDDIAKKGNEDSHLQFVSLQTVSGSWQLSADLASELGKTLKELEQAIPSYLRSKANIEMIWATVLAYTWLRTSKFLHVQEELELILNKAITWLDKELESTDFRHQLEADATNFLN